MASAYSDRKGKLTGGVPDVQEVPRSESPLRLSGEQLGIGIGIAMGSGLCLSASIILSSCWFQLIVASVSLSVCLEGPAWVKWRSENFRTKNRINQIRSRVDEVRNQTASKKNFPEHIIGTLLFGARSKSKQSFFFGSTEKLFRLLTIFRKTGFFRCDPSNRYFYFLLITSLTFVVVVVIVVIVVGCVVKNSAKVQEFSTSE